MTMGNMELEAHGIYEVSYERGEKVQTGVVVLDHKMEMLMNWNVVESGEWNYQKRGLPVYTHIRVAGGMARQMVKDHQKTLKMAGEIASHVQQELRAKAKARRLMGGVITQIVRKLGL